MQIIKESLSRQIRSVYICPSAETKAKMTIFSMKFKVTKSTLTLMSFETLVLLFKYAFQINRIYQYTAEGTRESYLGVQDLQSMTKHAESWILQIMDKRIGFPCLFCYVVINYSIYLTHFYFQEINPS